MNTLRYLSFEINRACPFAMAHSEACSIAHPERYMFSRSTEAISDETILAFWRWCRTKGFRGLVMWHQYNEPALSLARVLGLMRQMKAEDPLQPFQITTSSPGVYAEFDIVKVSDYAGGATLDRRILSAWGEGKPYDEMPKRGWCARGLGWEIPIDNFGNWGLCCNDWRNEESFGSICNEDWNVLLERWNAKRKRIRWTDEKTYGEMPRMCRSCLDLNPELSRRGGI